MACREDHASEPEALQAKVLTEDEQAHAIK
jgi:hypothetical protein